MTTTPYTQVSRGYVVVLGFEYVYVYQFNLANQGSDKIRDFSFGGFPKFILNYTYSM